MSNPTVKELVTTPGNECRFLRFTGPDMLWYEIVDLKGDRLFEFPIPVADTAGAVFGRTEKPVFCMRWIRIHVTLLASYHACEDKEQSVDE